MRIWDKQELSASKLDKKLDVYLGGGGKNNMECKNNSNPDRPVSTAGMSADQDYFTCALSPSKLDNKIRGIHFFGVGVKIIRV